MTVAIPRARWRLHDLPEVNARIQCELRVADNLEEYVRRTLSLGRGHTADAWTVARLGRCAMVFLDRGWVLWGHTDTYPDPRLVRECETVLRRLWREGFCHPMYNCCHHRGHREYMLTTEETAWIAPYPSSPSMASCWADVEDMNDRIRNAKGRSTEEEEDADLRRLQEEVQGRDDAFLGPGAVAPDVRRVLAEGEGPETRLRKLFQGDEGA